jgi:ABC-2 type transport system permease protein
VARLETSPQSEPSAKVSTRRQFAAITWLRWRIFVNSLRGKGAAGELVVKIISYPFLAIVILGPSVGAGFGSYYLVSTDQVSLLAIPLWIIFALWQFIGINTSSTGPSFDLSSLIRFPIRYRDYLLIRLSFGLMDPPTLAGIGCLIGMTVGIAIAAPWLLPWSALALFVYGICNILFSRMVYSWMERWLAQRRTRELFTGIILAVSLGAQFAAQYAQRLGHHGQHAPLSPWLTKTFDVMVFINWLLPPGLTALSIDHVHSGEPLIASAALGGVLAISIGFLLVLHLRLRAEFLGEDLSEAPAASKPKSLPISASVRTQTTAPAVTTPTAKASFSFLPPTVAGCLIKEIRYMLRSGPKLYALIMPVFVVFLVSMRSSGMNYVGVSRHSLTTMLFSYGCAYTQLIFVGLIYNAFGGDGTGVQFYFMAPVRMRDVVLGKNLMTLGIFAIEIILIYIASAIISRPAPLDLTAATVAWSFFTLFVSLSIGNIRSIVSPKVLDSARVRSQNVSGLNSLISLLVVATAVALGALMVLADHILHTGYWLAAAVFSVLAILAFVLYLLVLRNMDRIASDHVEDLTRVLGKV